jgi:hypothetical protein
MQEQNIFVDELFEITFFRKNVIMTGDFNHVKNNSIERVPPNKKVGSHLSTSNGKKSCLILMEIPE